MTRAARVLKAQRGVERVNARRRVLFDGTRILFVMGAACDVRRLARARFPRSAVSLTASETEDTGHRPYIATAVADWPLVLRALNRLGLIWEGDRYAAEADAWEVSIRRPSGAPAVWREPRARRSPRAARHR